MSKSVKMPELLPREPKGGRKTGLLGAGMADAGRGRRKERVRQTGGKSSRRVGR